MSIDQSNKRTPEQRESAIANGPIFSPRTAPTKLYDATGQPLGTFAFARDAFAVLDALDDVGGAAS